MQQEIREVKRAIVAVQAQVKEKEEELKQAPANERIYVRQEIGALQQQLPPLLQRLTSLTDLTGASRGRVASTVGTWLRVLRCMQPYS